MRCGAHWLCSFAQRLRVCIRSRWSGFDLAIQETTEIQMKTLTCQCVGASVESELTGAPVMLLIAKIILICAVMLFIAKVGSDWFNQKRRKG